MGCGPLQFICDAAGSVLGGATKAVAGAGFSVIAKSFAEAAKTMCDWMWSAISTTTSVDLSGGWFKSDIAITAEIAAVMVAALFVIQLIKGALRRDPHALARAVTGCGIAFIGASAAVIITESLLVLTDDLANGVVHTAGMGDLASMGRKMTPVVVLDGGTFTPALVIALSFFFVLASVLVWAVFIIRKAMIIVAAVFAPIAFGGASADATRGWVRRWIEFTLAMIFSKLVIVLIFTIAISLIGQSGPGAHGLSTLMTGLLLLVLACFAPWLVFKLVHYVGGDMAAAHHAGMMSDTKVAASTAAASTAKFKGTAQKVFAGTGSGGAGSGMTTAAPTMASAPAAVASTAGRVTGAPTRAATALSSAVPTNDATPSDPPKPGSAPPNPTSLSRHGVDWSGAT